MNYFPKKSGDLGKRKWAFENSTAEEIKAYFDDELTPEDSLSPEQKKEWHALKKRALLKKLCALIGD